MKRLLIYSLLFLFALNVTTLKADTYEILGTESNTKNAPSIPCEDTASVQALIDTNYPGVATRALQYNWEFDICIDNKPNENFAVNNELSFLQSKNIFSSGNTAWNYDQTVGNCQFKYTPQYTINCFYTCSKTCTSPQILNSDTCTCVDSPDDNTNPDDGNCEPAPPPEGLNLITVLPSMQECQAAQSQAGSYIYNNQTYTNLTCYSSGCENSPDTLLYGEQNSDVNSENPGSANDENDPCANLESTLKEKQRLKIGYPPGVYIGDTEKYDWGFIRVDNLIPECNAIIYTWFQCPHSQAYNKQLNKCEKLSDVTESDENCPSGYAKKQLYDFSKGLNYIPLWLQNLGAENGFCYYRYNCIDNYTLVKIKQVSCSSEWAVNEMEISSDSDNNSTIFDVKNPYENLDPSNPLDQEFAREQIDNIPSQEQFNETLASSTSASASALEDIKNALDGKDQNGTDEDVSELTGNFEQGDDLLSSISDSLVGIKSSYSDMFSKINQGFDVSISPGSDPTFSTTVRGEEISISFCPFLSQVAPIFYYIFYVTFMILGIKLFYLGFKINRG